MVARLGCRWISAIVRIIVSRSLSIDRPTTSILAKLMYLDSSRAAYPQKSWTREPRRICSPLLTPSSLLWLAALVPSTPRVQPMKLRSVLSRYRTRSRTPAVRISMVPSAGYPVVSWSTRIVVVEASCAPFRVSETFEK